MFFRGYRLETVNYDLLGGYVNSYILETENNIFVIDANVGSAKQQFEKTLSGFPSGKKPITVLLTHGHWDHVSLAGWLQAEYGAKVLAPAGSSRMMKDPEMQLTALYDRFATERPFSPQIRELYMKEFAYPASPDGIVSEGDGFCDTNFSLKVISTPGHWGDCVTYFEEYSRAAFCGDAVQADGLDGNAPFYVDAQAYICSIERLKALEPMMLLGGHMAVMGPSSCRQMLDLSVSVCRRIDAFLEDSDITKSPVVLAEEFCRRFGYAYGIHAVSVLQAHISVKERQKNAVRA